MMIEATNLTKDFKIPIVKDGFMNKVKSLFARDYIIKHAVDNISFHIDEGELVGYVGPNGAGKSTTIKMLSGILSPTSGSILVDGIIPYENRTANAMKIGVVFGQRSQLYWDLPMKDTFLLHKKMYEIEDGKFKRNVKLFIDIMQMEKFVDQPIRQLSLGQKMRANIALSLLHEPKIVYLDEPTIGLDIVAKNRIRECIREINRQSHTTFILTSHDMDDIEQVCNRLIMINHGVICYNGALSDFTNEFGDSYRIVARLGSASVVEHACMTVEVHDEFVYTISCKKTLVPVAEAVSWLTSHYDVREISIQESDVESILRDLYERSECSL
ncbi:MAG: ATP-binding cassette domain-containing protein [Treponema sp.]|jgi:ABC-2 type transport system ATP-binding protein|nr:ATP-binding cassette domain-containing protein [Treponema sp.]